MNVTYVPGASKKALATKATTQNTKYGQIKVTYSPASPRFMAPGQTEPAFFEIRGTSAYSDVTAVADTYQAALAAWMRRAADHVVA